MYCFFVWRINLVQAILLITPKVLKPYISTGRLRNVGQAYGIRSIFMAY